jgi:hypothetical protein
MENDIGLAWEFSRMQPKAKAHSMYQSTDDYFGLCPFTLNATHVFAAPFG